jgi:hypothetical protein
VLGALLGFWLAHILPDFSKPKKTDKVNTNPKALHRLVTFAADYIMYTVLSTIILIPFHFASISQTQWQWVSYAIHIMVLVALQFVVPMIYGGQTAFGKLTGVSLDDKPRTSLWRFAFYLARLAFIGAIVLLGNWVSVLLTVVMVFGWLIFNKLPYAAVDIFFHHSAKSIEKSSKAGKR